MISQCPRCQARYRGKLRRCPFDGAELETAPGDLTGSTLEGRFTVGEVIGAGAIGVVYHATDGHDGSAVAIKALHRDLMESRSHRERFLREARAMTRVAHRAVVVVLTVSDGDARPPWLAMRLYRGETLKAALERGPISIERARAIVGELARGLSVAHGAGVVHRDLKPANVMLVEGGPEPARPVIFDFGLAGVQGEAGLTDTGEIIGTPLYMSPEQIRSEPACPAMDQYALGCLWFELLAGRPPFHGKASAVLDAHLTMAAPAIESLVPEVPAEQAATIAELLAKTTERRSLAFARLTAQKMESGRF